jgi:Proto-chlorophyllide reductase 57 kD subunit
MFHQFKYSDELFWTTEAQLKLKKIPYFVRTQARQKIENLARTIESEEVTADIVEQARLKFGQ